MKITRPDGSLYDYNGDTNLWGKENFIAEYYTINGWYLLNNGYGSTHYIYKNNIGEPKIYCWLTIMGDFYSKILDRNFKSKE